MFIGKKRKDGVNPLAGYASSSSSEEEPEVSVKRSKVENTETVPIATVTADLKPLPITTPRTYSLEEDFPSNFINFSATEAPGGLTAISLTKKGHRIATGDSVGVVRLWNFSGGDSFESLCSDESAKGVHFCEWNNPANQVMVGTREKWLTIYDLKGTVVQRTYKGDMYIRDTANTPGHTHEIYDAKWHPTVANSFASSSLDGTVRVWDLVAKPRGLEQLLPSLVVLKAVDSNNSSMTKNCGVNKIDWMDTSSIVGACEDDSVQLWDARISGSKGRRSKLVFRGHHEAEPITDIAALDPSHIFSRSVNYIAYLDARNPKEPVRRVEIKAHNLHRGLIAPVDSGHYLATVVDSGISLTASVVYLESETLSEVQRSDFMYPDEGTTFNMLCVHDKLQQIFLAASNGMVFGAYGESGDESSGMRGFKLTEEGYEGDESRVVDSGVNVDASYSWDNLPANIKQYPDETIRLIKPRRRQFRAQANPARPSR